MIQKQNNSQDLKQESSFLREDSQIPVPGNSALKIGYEFYDHLILKFKTYSFIVDWQMPGIEKLEVEIPHS
jgi:hypothetical protein